MIFKCFLTTAFFALSLTASDSFIFIEDAPISSNGKYIKPNELSPTLFALDLEDLAPAAVVSVGTFRGLFAATMSNANRLILVDCDESTTLFNRLHIALIKAIGEEDLTSREQILQYLALLHGDWFSSEDLKSHAAEFSEQKVSEILMLLSKREKNKNIPEHLGKLLFAFSEVVTKINDSNYEAYSRRPLKYKKYFDMLTWNKDEGLTLEGFLDGFDLSSMNRAKISGYNLYYESETSWQKIQDLIKANRIHAVLANLAGDKALDSISRELRNNNETVSVVDISNVPGFLNQAQLDAMMTNIRKLPLSNDALLLETFLCGDRMPPKELMKQSQTDQKWWYTSRRIF